MVAEYFPLGAARGQEGDGAGAMLRQPLRGVDLMPGPGTEPGRVRIYNTQDVLGTVPGAYGTVLEAGAMFTGVGADDVAGVALLLASPAGSFINGQVIGVDGGASAW